MNLGRFSSAFVFCCCCSVQVSSRFERRSLNQFRSAPLHFTICKKSGNFESVLDVLSKQIKKKMILYYVYMSCYSLEYLAERQTKKENKIDSTQQKNGQLNSASKPTAN